MKSSFLKPRAAIQSFEISLLFILRGDKIVLRKSIGVLFISKVVCNEMGEYKAWIWVRKW